MSTILAIDPGCTESAYALIDHATRRPIEFDKVSNTALRSAFHYSSLVKAGDHVTIEMIASYGMPVGVEVFETCVWIGRFAEAIHVHTGREPHLVKRQPIKLHHCHSSKATDANVAQALKDRFAYGVRNHGKGTKAEPGWFYGFKADIWQAYALAVYAADTAPTKETP